MGILRELLPSITRLDELSALYEIKFGKGRVRSVHQQDLEHLTHLSPLDFCYEALNKVSRSFAYVIQILPEDLKDAVCVFYLVLRALDTVEDDMSIPQDLKLPLLLQFHEKLYEHGWTIRDIGKKDEKTLLEQFDKVIDVFSFLKTEYQDVISEITKRMGAGMHAFSEKIVVKTLKEYDEYCHYVAGLVGYGLSALFSASGLEDASLAQEYHLSNSMGLFLQKTNIIRDYCEDLDEDRTFWPEEIWKQYASELDWFNKNPDSEQSINCLNHLVLNALELVPACLDYMFKLRNEAIFRFCGIPQVMAIATLTEVYDNKKVFTSNVKIRKGLSAKLMMTVDTYGKFKATFFEFARNLKSKVRDPESNLGSRTIALCDSIMKRTQPEPVSPSPSHSLSVFSIAMAVAVISYIIGYAMRLDSHEQDILFRYRQVGVFACLSAFLLGYGIRGLGWTSGSSIAPNSRSSNNVPMNPSC